MTSMSDLHVPTDRILFFMPLLEDGCVTRCVVRNVATYIVR